MKTPAVKMESFASVADMVRATAGDPDFIHDFEKLIRDRKTAKEREIRRLKRKIAKENQ